MTRFDATDAAGRRKLVADAVQAHRERGSGFCTLEADPADVPGGDDDTGSGADAGTVEGLDEEPSGPEPPWVQFGGDVLNLDVTDEEYDRFESLLSAYPSFKIRERESPEGADGTNLKVGALADAARVAGFVDELFTEVYGLPDGYRLWVTGV